MRISENHFKEWEKLVSEARENIKGNHHHYKDESIIAINEYINMIEDQNKELIEKLHRNKGKCL